MFETATATLSTTFITGFCSIFIALSLFSVPSLFIATFCGYEAQSSENNNSDISHTLSKYLLKILTLIKYTKIIVT